jgi:hypothetical protein
MPKTKRDAMKRQAAQALNNSAKAILDINAIYDEFKEVKPEHAATLATIMIDIAKAREKLLVFVENAWMLDEEHIMGWLA